ncbi:MAG: T9SS type A sorting domain-containing protein [Bacteroidota bacterium]
MSPLENIHLVETLITYDATGKEMLRTKATGQPINFSHFKTGLYYVSLVGRNFRLAKKIIRH